MQMYLEITSPVTTGFVCVCVEVMVVLAPNKRRISSKGDMMILHVIMLKPCIGLIPQQGFDF